MYNPRVWDLSLPLPFPKAGLLAIGLYASCARTRRRLVDQLTHESRYELLGLVMVRPTLTPTLAPNPSPQP